MALWPCWNPNASLPIRSANPYISQVVGTTKRAADVVGARGRQHARDDAGDSSLKGFRRTPEGDGRAVKLWKAAYDTRDPIVDGGWGLLQLLQASDCRLPVLCYPSPLLPPPPSPPLFRRGTTPFHPPATLFSSICPLYRMLAPYILKNLASIDGPVPGTASGCPLAISCVLPSGS